MNFTTKVDATDVIPITRFDREEYISRIFRVDGIDIQPEFAAIAAERVPAGRFSVADMRDFDLGLRHDVVLCLFSSIGYLTRAEQVVAALDCFKRHLNPGGAVIVEPWFSPEQWKVGMVHMLTVDQPELKICRMSTSARKGRLSQVRFHYLIGRPGGVEHVTEDHELALCSPEEMLECFGQAGLAAEHDPEGIFGRGLYVDRASVPE